MRFYAILLLVFVVHHGEAEHCKGDPFREIVKDCLVAEKANKEDFNDFFDLKKAASKNAKCFRACIMKKCKFMAASGKFVRTTFTEYLPRFALGDVSKEGRIDSVFEKCLKMAKAEGNDCKTVDDYMTCFIRECNGCVPDVYATFGVTKL